ncbi:hypothetical protein QBC43DRAFT_373536 [Cladorrhinum sp. PSN259]|nr:hypothetical protein QBC43DRAFT_373536 [Cladorrhinum sp. PSN259]
MGFRFSNHRQATVKMAPRPKEQPSKRSLKPKGSPNLGAWMVHRSNPSVIDREYAPVTCLSALPHGPEAIRDHLRHYFGCINIADRVNYLNRSNPMWEYEYIQELRHLKSLPKYSVLAEREVQNDAENRVQKKIQSVAVALEAQYRRTYILRQALSKAPDPAPDPDRPAETCGHLVRCVEDSREAWRNDAYQYGISEVQRWKANPSDPPPPAQQGHPPAAHIVDEAFRVPDPDQLDFAEERKKIRQIVKSVQNGQEPPLDTELADYDLERDVDGYLIQYTLETPWTHASRQSTTTDPTGIGPAFRERTESPTRTTFPDSFSGPIPDRGNTLRSHLNPVNEELTDSRFNGRFPNQRINVSLLLGLNDVRATAQENADKGQSFVNTGARHLTDNILSRDNCQRKDPTRIRYFHIPANNMDWVEKAIARYYDEEQPDLSNSISDPPVKTHTQMLLRPQLWRGQQQGARSGVVHARHMRPLCERISSETDEIEHNPKNIVLFMPYLHWETDRLRSKMAQIIAVGSERTRRKQEGENIEMKNIRKAGRIGLKKPDKMIEHPDADSLLLEWFRQKGGLGEQTQQVRDLRDIFKCITPSGINHDSRLQVASRLGQYLMDAARLYEAMSTYRDRRLLEEYLNRDPPLHPRRTLDQYYYSNLKTTEGRDRDQVVYRGTSANWDTRHKLEFVSQSRQKKSLLGRLGFSNDPMADGRWQWSGHSKETDENGCNYCHDNVRKTSQVVMVDQLWMWVLDENTIITSFPSRYGLHHGDLSGVHESIRKRLRSAQKNQIQSIYDIALVVLDECTNTFFDRTKTEDSQPEVMDIFSKSIGYVASQQIISFQRAWYWTEKAFAIYRSRSKYVETAGLHVPLLNIQSEGKLQREVEDIIDELGIMIDIHMKQRPVIKRFCKHVERILDPEGPWQDGADYEEIQSYIPPNIKKEADLRRCKKREQLHRFRFQSHELLAEVDNRLEELGGLKKNAEGIAKKINDLLSLKQQQASIVQIWESVRQAEESSKQGGAIIMLTVITLIFLPLSFISSVFGMNNRDFGGPDNPWSVHEQFLYIIPISLGVIVLSVTVAFTELLPLVIAFCNVLWSIFTYMTSWIIIKLHIYELWLAAGEEWSSMRMRRQTEEAVREMKAEVKKARRRRARKGDRGDRRDRAQDGNKGEGNPQNEICKNKKKWWGGRRGGKKQDKEVLRRVKESALEPRHVGGKGGFRISNSTASASGGGRGKVAPHSKMGKGNTPSKGAGVIVGSDDIV